MRREERKRRNIHFRTVRQRFGGYLLFIGVLWFFFVCPFMSYGAQGRVFDQAGIFTDSEIIQLERGVNDFTQTTKQDAVIVTAWAQTGKTAEEYADDFYDENDFGTGKTKSGVLLLYYMDGPGSQEGTYWISICGNMIQIMTDAKLDRVKNHLSAYLKKRDFAGGAEAFLEDTAMVVKQGVQSGQYTYDRDTGEIHRYRSIRWYEAAFAAGISLFAGAAVCLDVKRRYAMKLSGRQQENGLLAYRAQAGFHFTDTDDRLIHQFTTHVRIAKQNDIWRGGFPGGGNTSGRSTTHHSSSGRSHGGGGGRF